MTHKCCSNCFTDKTLKIKINQTGEISRCHYCGNNDSSTLRVNELYPLISPLLEAILVSYDEDPSGIDIISILNTDFKFFNGSTFEQIIKDALDDKPDLLNKKFKPFALDTLNEWESFKSELKHHNRFFPQTEIYKEAFLEKGRLFEIFTEVIEQLNFEITTTDSFYRSRISDIQLEHKDMGKPPAEKVGIGRANPDGISYLYIAENIKTALLEVRPSNGQNVLVAEFKAPQALNVVNLKNPRKDISFLSLSLNENFKSILKLVSLLEEFSKELTLPVLPNRSRLDYIPTQFITEFFKNLGNIGGIMFNSSFGKGFNLVVFSEESIRCVESKTIQSIKIDGVDITYV